jgi:hypothetical protein
MKKLNGYELNITKNDEVLQFKFISEGAKGVIEKIIEFNPIRKGVWNLGFGDKIGDDWTDDIVSNNADMRVVIQTVANAVYSFFEYYETDEIFIEPSDYKRKILYNRIFKQKWHEIEPNFIVRAINLDIEKSQFEAYNPKEIYDYFIVKQRIV